jgi:hypothetical protein
MTVRPTYPESDLMEPLIQWLRVRRFVREDSAMIQEFPWQGRLVDLAVMTKSGSTSAFELKLFHTQRAILQSSLNSMAFDRSYVVLRTQPQRSNLLQAGDLGLGVIVVNLDSLKVRQVLAPKVHSAHCVARRKLRAALKERAGRPSVC